MLHHSGSISVPRPATGCFPGKKSGGRLQRALVLEVPCAGEDHSHALAVGGGDGLVVADRAAGLDDRRDPRLDGVLHAVGEGEVGVRGQHRAA